MRVALVTALCLLTGVCAASNYRDIQRAVGDDQMLKVPVSLRPTRNCASNAPRP